MIIFDHFYVFHLIFSKFLSMIPIREILSPPSDTPWKGSGWRLGPWQWQHCPIQECKSLRCDASEKVCEDFGGQASQKWLMKKHPKAKLNKFWEKQSSLGQVEVSYGKIPISRKKTVYKLDSSANLEPSREGRQNIWPCFQGVKLLTLGRSFHFLFGLNLEISNNNTFHGAPFSEVFSLLARRLRRLLSVLTGTTVDGSEIRQTIWDVENPVNTGINYQPELVSGISSINSITHVIFFHDAPCLMYRTSLVVRSMSCLMISATLRW